MTTKTKETSANTTRVHVVVTLDLKKALKEKAEKEGRSISGLVNFVLTEYLKKNAGR